MVLLELAIISPSSTTFLRRSKPPDIQLLGHRYHRYRQTHLQAILLSSKRGYSRATVSNEKTPYDVRWCSVTVALHLFSIHDLTDLKRRLKFVQVLHTHRPTNQTDERSNSISKTTNNEIVHHGKVSGSQQLQFVCFYSLFTFFFYSSNVMM